MIKIKLNQSFLVTQLRVPHVAFQAHEVSEHFSSISRSWRIQHLTQARSTAS